jgi:hypothetical protein
LNGDRGRIFREKELKLKLETNYFLWEKGRTKLRF